MNSNTYSLGRASANTQLPLRRIRGLGFANAFGVRQLEDVIRKPAQIHGD